MEAATERPANETEGSAFSPAVLFGSIWNRAWPAEAISAEMRERHLLGGVTVGRDRAYQRSTTPERERCQTT